MITIILNGYKRPHVLEAQYNAIQNQTCKQIDDVMLWSNYDQMSFDKYPTNIIEKCTSSFCNKNLGVWARFAYALNSFSQYICMIDDDTIPGSKWLDNCVETMKSHRGVLGCRGVRMTGDDYRNYPGCQYETFGASNPNTQVERVDIMGHCWFFEREWLRAYWAEAPSSPLPRGGEDMHMSYSVQKHFELNTYVPPHPPDDKEMWGSTDPNTYGEDMFATSRTSDGHMQAHSYWNYIISQGYKLTKDQK